VNWLYFSGSKNTEISRGAVSYTAYFQPFNTSPMNFSDLTSDQILRGNAAISLPKYGINHLPIVKVTAKAICIEMNESSWVHKSIKSIWLPISQIDLRKTYRKANFVDSDPSDDKENCIYFQIDLPEWLLRKNKII